MEPQPYNVSERLREIISRNRRSEKVGVYAVCSAHPSVIAAAVQQAVEDESVLHVESTSSQVNQLGGYTGQTPAQFAEFVHSAAQQGGLPRDRVLLGGDHLGPYPWREQPWDVALQKARELVRSCVLAGYTKIHLDASMACADDGTSGPDQRTIAQRAAILCRAAESAFADLPQGSSPPLYVIGTEVPAPGGESLPGAPPAVSPADQIDHTLELFRAAFDEQSVAAAWERVIGMVVQPGVEFGENVIFDYARQNAMALSSALPKTPSLAYEAHSTDYQKPAALAQMVEDHFAILKVGPWLTFAFREAVFALGAIERELLAQRRGVRLSQVREALQDAMLRNPVYWRSYYHGSEDEIQLARIYSYSDRCRYFWGDPEVQQELAHLRANLDVCPVPPTLFSQHLPSQYEAIRSGRLSTHAEDMIQEHIRTVLHVYAAACGNRTVRRQVPRA
ncbi:MAG: class II D-tagatose-bisphosphate aldolase, non-catalytic subunit [Terriglobales bacterium]|jgi:D-tagatose-1,6-bisphosphate aldolase subunit GatZ/KbaZ